MLEFRCRKLDESLTPIISNEEIRDYAEALVRDYRPSLLKEPGKINPFHFIESYLGAGVDYQDIYYEEGAPAIAGATVFHDEKIPVFDRDNQCVKAIPVRANTIILDNATVAEGKDGFALFTALHEAGHLCMHQAAYGKRETGSGNILCCRKMNIGRYDCGSGLTDSYLFREHQANEFAAFLAMPRRTFVPYARELIKEAGFDDGVFLHDDKSWESDYALDTVIGTLRNTFGTSYTAVRIHLRKLGLLKRPFESEP